MKFEVKERVVRIAEDYAIIGDNADYTAEFVFDSEWDGVTKTARFMRDGKYVDKLLTDDKCEIPVEVLKRGKVTVGVYSAKMTTTGVSVVVAESVKEKTGNVLDPTPNIYEQLTGKLDEIQAELPEAVENHFNAHKDELKGEKGDKGDKGEQGIQGIQGVQGEKGVVDYSLVANALKGKASGEVVRVDDVSPVEHTARVKVVGKNIFNIKNIAVTSSGADNSHISQVGDDYITITTPETHTLTSYTTTRKTLKELCPNIEVGKTYTLTANTDSQKNTLLYIANVKVSWHFGESIKITAEMLDKTVILYGFDIIGGESAGDCKISNIQIEEGDTATEYTPYINPESVTVKTSGKNLFCFDNASGDASGIYRGWLVNPTKKEVVLSVIDKDASVDISNIYFGFTGNGVDSESYYWAIENGEIKLKNAISKLRYISIYPNNDETLNKLKQRFDIQVEYGIEATDYEAHKGGTYTPATDGTLEIPSISPSMTIIADKAVNIDLEYNKDINAVINGIMERLAQI